MTLSLRRVIDDSDLEPFEFEDLEGNTRTLPHLQTLTPRQAMQALDGDIESVLRGDPDRGTVGIAPDIADLLLDLPTFAIDKLILKWMEHSEIDAGATEGKSPARSRSSATTRTPSKRTSRSAASRSKR